MHTPDTRRATRASVAGARGNAQRGSPARLPRDVLMKMLMADMALLDRLERVCREGAGTDAHAAASERLRAAADMAHELSASKETLAAALLSLALESAPERRPLS